ncbi:MAG: hypothetical protein HWN67_18170 [Candidatus Helarchaeota archaeon]|nr:hypothetical protein [Candidatus Helarchaeota archaeon]
MKNSSKEIEHFPPIFYRNLYLNPFDNLKEKLEELNCVIHSINQIVVRKSIIEEVRTHQE